MSLTNFYDDGSMYIIQGVNNAQSFFGNYSKETSDLSD